MKCPECGKVLPDNAAHCKKCGTVFKENKGNAEMDAFLKKEKEKAAARNEKNKKRGSKKPASKGLIIGIASAVAVVGIAVALLLHFDIIGSRSSHRTEEAGPLDVEYTFKIDEENAIVLTFGDVKITDAEYEFFFRQSYSNLQNSTRLAFKEFVSKKLGADFDENSDYYEEYFSEFEAENPNTFDYNRPIDLQSTQAIDDETGEELLWWEYIRNDAIKSMSEHRIKFELAQDMGFELTDDVRLQVYDHIEGLRDAVKQGGYPDLDTYLKILFGEACDEEFFKNELIREYMATKYETEINAVLMDEYSDEEIKAAYESDYKNFDFADIYAYEVKGEGAQEIAQKIAKDATSLSEFTKAVATHVSETASREAYPAVPKYYIDGTYSAEMGDWSFDRQRKQGDVSVFKTKNGYTVAFVYVPVYTKENCVSYREILLKKTDGSGKALADEALLAVEEKAEDLFKQWKKSDKTQDDFAYLAMSESQGENASSGGLEAGNVAMNMDDGPLKDWLVSNDRKPGEVEIVETDDAYRLVYFIKHYGDYWNYSVRQSKAGEAAAQKIETAKNKTYALNINDKVLRELELEYISDISENYLGIKQK